MSFNVISGTLRELQTYLMAPNALLYAFYFTSLVYYTYVQILDYLA